MDINQEFINICEDSDFQAIKQFLKLINFENLIMLKPSVVTNLHYLKFKKYNYSGQPVLAPLIWHACINFNLKIIKMFFESKININIKTETLLNSTPLMCACLFNDYVEIKYLVIFAHANINIVDQTGENCLFYAFMF